MNDLGTSVIYAVEYLVGLFIFGLVYVVLDGILRGMAGMSLVDSVYLFAMLCWGAAVLIYLLFGAFYFWRQIRTWLILR